MRFRITTGARRFGLLCLLSTLAACGGAAPNSAIPDNLAERFYGTREAATPIAALVRDHDIHTPDFSSSTPPLEQLRRELAKTDPDDRQRGDTFELTTGNTLGDDWLVQSPDRWGRSGADLPFYPLQCQGDKCQKDVALPSCNTDADCGGGTCGTIWPASGTSGAVRRKVCLGHSDRLVDRLHGLVASARRSVDITLLQPVTDTRFLAAFRRGLFDLAQSGRPVEVRVLIGQYPPGGSNAAAFLKELVAEAQEVPTGRLSVHVAAMRSCTAFEKCNSFSWNHAKIVSIDGRDALVGGHNLWSADYLIDNPVHDLSMSVRGPAANSASRFADRLWRHVCDNAGKQSDSIQIAAFVAGQSTPNNSCPLPIAPQQAAPAAQSGGVPILAVGRLGAGVSEYFGNYSELARSLMFGAARKSIRIVQQDLGFRLGRSDILFPESDFERFADFLQQGYGEIFIVLSNDGSLGNAGFPYHNDVPVAVLARRLRDVLAKRFEKKNERGMVDLSPRKGPDPVNALLCSRVHIAPFRFGPDESWPGGKTIANHSKLWMVDDRVFYLGSDNMYPVNLQEFGYIVDDRRAAQQLLDAYWTPLWQWSKRAAVSGDGAKSCIFRDLIR